MKGRDQRPFSHQQLRAERRVGGALTGNANQIVTDLLSLIVAAIVFRVAIQLALSLCNDKRDKDQHRHDDCSYDAR